MSEKFWTPEQDDKLRELWGMSLSCTEIGKQIGKTKSAITGRAHRLKLPQRPSPIRDRPVSKPKEPKLSPRLTSWRRIGEEKGPSKLPDYKVDLSQLSANVGGSRRHCQFIPGEPAGEHTLYCGAPPVEGHSYCLPHMKICFSPRPPQKGTLNV